MNLINRLIVLILALVALLGGVLVLLVLTGAIAPEEIPGGLLLPQFESVAKGKGAALGTNIGIAIALLLGGLLVLVMELRPLASGPRMVLVSAGEQGVVRIALESIRELAEKTGGGNRSVRSLKCRVRVTPSGLRILCLANLNLGSDVPIVSSELQKSIDDAVERLTGLPVIDVAVRARYGGDGELSLVAR